MGTSEEESMGEKKYKGPICTEQIEYQKHKEKFKIILNKGRYGKPLS